MILFVVGIVSMILGVIGIILPVLPTTPFLLLSLWCFIRSSEKFYGFILENEYLGPYVKEYVEGDGISIEAKKKSIFMLWITISISAFLFVDKTFVRGIMFIVAISVTVYILSRKTAGVKKNN